MYERNTKHMMLDFLLAAERLVSTLTNVKTAMSSVLERRLVNAVELLRVNITEMPQADPVHGQQ